MGDLAGAEGAKAEEVFLKKHHVAEKEGRDRVVGTLWSCPKGVYRGMEQCRFQLEAIAPRS